MASWILKLLSQVPIQSSCQNLKDCRVQRMQDREDGLDGTMMLEVQAKLMPKH